METIIPKRPCQNEGCATKHLEATKRIAGHHFCKPCALGIQQEVMRRGKIGKFNAKQAIFRSRFIGR